MKQIAQKSKKRFVVLLVTILLSIPLLFAAPILDSLSGGLSLFMAVLGIGAKDFELQGFAKSVTYAAIYFVWFVLAFACARKVVSPFFAKNVAGKTSNSNTAPEASAEVSDI